MNTSENRSLAVRVGEVVTIGVMLFFLGAGIGLWQGHASGVEETTTALFAGPVATVIGLLLYFLVLKRTVTFAESAWIASGEGLAGIAVALFLKIASGGQLGWVSVFVTPLAAFLIALVLRRPR